MCIHGNIQSNCPVCSLSQKTKPAMISKDLLPTELKVGMASEEQIKDPNLLASTELHESSSILKNIPPAPKRLGIDQPVNSIQNNQNILIEERIKRNASQRFDLEGFDKEIELIDVKKRVRSSLI